MIGKDHFHRSPNACLGSSFEPGSIERLPRTMANKEDEDRDERYQRP